MQLLLQARVHWDMIFLVYCFPHSHLNSSGNNSICVGSVDLSSGLLEKAFHKHVKLVVKEGFFGEGNMRSGLVFS